VCSNGLNGWEVISTVANARYHYVSYRSQNFVRVSVTTDQLNQKIGNVSPMCYAIHDFQSFVVARSSNSHGLTVLHLMWVATLGSPGPG
jgi:hypothetical protein